MDRGVQGLRIPVMLTTEAPWLHPFNYVFHYMNRENLKFVRSEINALASVTIQLRQFALTLCSSVMQICSPFHLINNRVTEKIHYSYTVITFLNLRIKKPGDITRLEPIFHVIILY